MAAKLICVDIGGTQTRVGISTAFSRASRRHDAQIIARFPTAPDYDAQIAAIRAAVPDPPPDRPYAAVGVAIGAQLAPDGQSVLAAPNMPAYVGRRLAADLTAAFSIPAYLGHDTVCGLIAERHYGRLGDYDRAAYMTLSTGNGAAFHLRQRAHAMSCSIEFAHQILDGNDRRCLCGQTGCLETYTGGRQMARFATEAEMATDAFWEVFCQKLAIGIVNLVKLTRTTAIAVGGAIALARPTILPHVESLANAQLAAAHVTLFPAALGEDAPLLGAALLWAIPPAEIVH